MGGPSPAERAMSVKRIMSITVAVLMVSSVALGGALASSGPILVSSQDTDATAYAGTHVSFDADSNALLDYTVADVTIVESVEVESANEAEERGVLGAGVELSTATDVEAGDISVTSESDTQVEIESESDASIDAHDSQHGHLLVTAGGEGALIAVNVSAETDAERDGDARVVVTHDDGTQGTFIVVGDGEVTVNNEGNVTAELESDSKLAYLQYDDERSDEDKDREALIADGTAAAEVYVTTAAEGSSELAADVVEYGHDTTVDVTTYSENQIEMTAERTESEGKVVITSVSEQAFEHADEIDVHVDGEAATHVETKNELEAAADGGENAAYAVRSASTAEASSEVLVALNHFSERDVTISSAESDDGSSGTDDGGAAGDDSSASDDEVETIDADDSLPGFGFGVAMIALLTSGLLALRRRH